MPGITMPQMGPSVLMVALLAFGGLLPWCARSMLSGASVRCCHRGLRGLQAQKLHSFQQNFSVHVMP
jgi:hypothetical protein